MFRNHTHGSGTARLCLKVHRVSPRGVGRVLSAVRAVWPHCAFVLGAWEVGGGLRCICLSHRLGSHLPARAPPGSAHPPLQWGEGVRMHKTQGPFWWLPPLLPWESPGAPGTVSHSATLAGQACRSSRHPPVSQVEVLSGPAFLGSTLTCGHIPRALSPDTALQGLSSRRCPCGWQGSSPTLLWAFLSPRRGPASEGLSRGSWWEHRHGRCGGGVGGGLGWATLSSAPPAGLTQSSPSVAQPRGPSAGTAMSGADSEGSQ